MIEDAEITRARQEVLSGELDLPELAESYEEAEARVLADRFLRALHGIRAEQGANVAELERTIAFYEERHRERQAVLVRREAFVVDRLKYLFSFLPLRGKAKSLNLLAGRVGTRKHPGRLRIVDEAALMAWARGQAPALITTPPAKERILVTDVAKWVEEQQPQDLPPGVEREQDQEEFFADPAALDVR